MQSQCDLCFQSGLIRVLGEEYLITPLPEHLAQRHNYSAPDGHHPHVLYKRSAEHVIHAARDEPSGHFSSTSVNHDHQQHHHHSQHGKLQRQHFCGRRKQCM